MEMELFDDKGNPQLDANGDQVTEDVMQKVLVIHVRCMEKYLVPEELPTEEPDCLTEEAFGFYLYILKEAS